MAKINLNNLDLDAKEVSYPRKEKIKKRKNKTEGDINNIPIASKPKSPFSTIVLMYSL